MSTYYVAKILEIVSIFLLLKLLPRKNTGCGIVIDFFLYRSRTK